MAINSNNTINLNKYLTVEATGYDGYRTPNAKIDWKAINLKYGTKLSFTKEAKEQYGELLFITTPVDVLKNDVNVRFDISDSLSNGDEVSYTWSIDEEISKFLNCKLKYEDSKFKVSGLKRLKSLMCLINLNLFIRESPLMVILV